MPTVEQMMKRQRVLADFGEFALRSENLDEVLTEACRLVGEALGTDRAKVLEIQDDGRELLVRSGVGWAPDIVGHVRLQMSERSSETYSIREGKPVISQDISKEDRFEIPTFMKDAGVAALINVPIFVPGQQPYGLLQVDASEPRAFGEDEIEFLRTYTTILGPVIDRLCLVEERHETRKELRVLVDELQHRTRNLMSVVRATMENTLRSSIDLEDFGAKYRDRIEALSRVQRLLSRLNSGERVTFDNLIRDEISAVGALDRVTLNGPGGVALRSGTVQTFALALHELATNAVKYGALTQPGGRLAITWRLEAAQGGSKPWLHVDWHESGVTMPPAHAAPQGTGQGRLLIERALPYQLGAKTTFVIGPDGVRCSIAVPVSDRTGVRERGDDIAHPP